MRPHLVSHVERMRRQGERTRRIVLGSLYPDRTLSVLGLARKVGRTTRTIRTHLRALGDAGLAVRENGRWRRA